jgi:hypothetical protein
MGGKLLHINESLILIMDGGNLLLRDPSCWCVHAGGQFGETRLRKRYKIRTHLLMSSGARLVDTYIHWSIFIENEIWARGGCTTTAVAEKVRRDRRARTKRSKEEREELPSFDGARAARRRPSTCTSAIYRIIRQGSVGKAFGCRWEHAQ